MIFIQKLLKNFKKIVENFRIYVEMRNRHTWKKTVKEVMLNLLKYNGGILLKDTKPRPE